MNAEFPFKYGTFQLRGTPQKFTNVQEDGPEKFAPSSNLVRLIPKSILYRSKRHGVRVPSRSSIV